jgi:hypothetical protein
MPPQTTFLLLRFATLPHSYSFSYAITRCSSYGHTCPTGLHNALPRTLPGHLRALSTTAPKLKLPRQLPPRRVILDSEIEEKFLHGSGPGGQKINKTSSAVQLKHLATGIVIKCQETRSRTQNRKLARQILAQKLEDIEKGDESRTVLKAKEKSRKKASADKKKKRKYRALSGAKAGEEGEDVNDEDGVVTEAEEDIEGSQGERRAVEGDTKAG